MNYDENKYFNKFCEDKGIEENGQKDSYIMTLNSLNKLLNITIDDIAQHTKEEAKQTIKLFEKKLKERTTHLTIKSRFINQIKDIYQTFNIVDYSKYDIMDNDYFKEYTAKKELSNNTMKKYVQVMSKYLEFIDKSFEETLKSPKDEIKKEIQKYEESVKNGGYNSNHLLQPVKSLYMYFNKLERKQGRGRKGNVGLKKGICSNTVIIKNKKPASSMNTTQDNLMNNSIFNKMCIELNIDTDSKQKKYKKAVEDFLKANGMTFDELIKNKLSSKDTEKYINKFKGSMYINGIKEDKIQDSVKKVEKVSKYLYFNRLGEEVEDKQSCEYFGKKRALKLKKDPSYKLTNDPIFNKIVLERNLKPNTRKCYESGLMEYLAFHNMTLKEMIDEAEMEEEQGIRMKNRKIKQRLIDFRTVLINKDMTSSTVSTYVSKVKTIYSHMEIEIPELPRVKMKNDRQVTYFDLPTRDHIREALELCDIKGKALILFMSSSGTARAETISLTVRDFIQGCKEYTSKTDLEDILKELQYCRDIVPTIYLRRIKTDKLYYTFCSPEASYHIIRELLQRGEVDYDDPLFDFSTPGLLSFFQKINDAKKWGRVGKYRFFRSHALRKYHASNIGLPTEYIDALEGRSKNKVHDTYIKTNPEKLKEKYMECMGNVMIGAIPLKPSDFKPEPRRQMSSSTCKPNPAAPSGTVLDIIPNTTGGTMVTNSGNNSRVTRVIRSHGEVRRGQRKIRDTNKIVSFFSVG